MNEHLEYIYSTDGTTRVVVYEWCYYSYRVEDLTPVDGVPGGRWLKDRTYWGLDEDSTFHTREEAIQHARENVLR